MSRIALALLLVFFGASCTSGTEPSVEMTDARSFEPATLTVSSGDTVTWTNDGDESHTVTPNDDAGGFGSGGFDRDSARGHLTEALVAPDESYSFRFETAGTYRYICIPHEDQGMSGTIVVED